MNLKEPDENGCITLQPLSIYQKTAVKPTKPTASTPMSDRYLIQIINVPGDNNKNTIDNK